MTWSQRGRAALWLILAQCMLKLSELALRAYKRAIIRSAVAAGMGDLVPGRGRK